MALHNLEQRESQHERCGNSFHRYGFFFSCNYNYKWCQISTNESCLQIINRPALKALELFLNLPSHETLPRLAPIPCLYHLVIHQWTQYNYFPSELLIALEWIKTRACDIIQKSISYEVPPVVNFNTDADGGWKKVYILFYFLFLSIIF